MYDLSSGHLICSFVFDAAITAVTMDIAEHHLFAGSVSGDIFVAHLYAQVIHYCAFFSYLWHAYAIP